MRQFNVNGWSTVLAGALGIAAGAGVVAVYVFGVFIKSVAAEYGWDRSQTTLGITCFYISSGVGSVILGSALARWPIRSVTILFVLLFSLALASVALLPNSVPLFCLTFSIIGFFGSAAGPMPYAVAISGWFDRNRGFALALAVSGAAVSGVFMSSYANWLMENWGWRGGYAGVGILVGAMALVGLLCFFRAPPGAPATASISGPLGLSEIWTGDRTFWFLGTAIFLISVSLAGVITNLPPMLTDRGFPMVEAAFMLGVVGGSSAVSRLAVGLLLDRFHARLVAAAIFTLIAIGVALIGLAHHGWALHLGLVLIGLGLGSESDLVTYSVSRYYAPQALSKALAGVWIFWAWGSGLGVLLASMSYDILGSYDAAYALYAVASAASAAVILQLGGYRFPPHSKRAVQDASSS